MESAPLPSPRQEIYATTFDGRIYTAGGLTDGATVVKDDFLVYDPANNRWDQLPDLPSARHHITLSAVNGVIYALGGFSGGFPG
ncbi:kelch repeat-containing protein [uncultured Algimonas sp.]|uniref:kelch repeat-containing protein n=1 Tax=uncultured Algimonas sp. TaxID=1547920 RepID=UPI00344DF7A0